MTKKHSIAVLLPTRGRTTALDRSVYSIIDTAADPSKIQLLLGFDRDDTAALEHFDTNLRPALEQRNINFVAMKFAPLGYVNIHKYYNHLAKYADADWMFIWNDDAFASTQGWDQVVEQYAGQLKVLKLHTHNEHPYSIFPIVPHTWIDLLGYLTGHQMIDAWISQIAYMLDLIEIVDIGVTHDRHDLTGNNADATFKGRTCLEGKPHDPADFHHPAVNLRRIDDCNKIATYMRSQGISTAWWEAIQAGRQDPWEKLKANDVNQQMVQFNMTVNPATDTVALFKVLMSKQIHSQTGDLLASILSADSESARDDAAGAEEILQACKLRLPQGKTVSPHRHLPLERTTQGTQEAWVVISGVIEVQVFDIDSTLVQSATLGAGDCMVLYRGGHTFTVMSEDAVLYEIKNGPYYGPAADLEKIQ